MCIRDSINAYLDRIGSLRGDANFDGVVNPIDLNRMALNWQVQTGMSWHTGDFDCNGQVNAIDLNAIALNWQVAAAPVASVIDAGPHVPASRIPRAPLAAVVGPLEPDPSGNRDNLHQDIVAKDIAIQQETRSIDHDFQNYRAHGENRFRRSPHATDVTIPTSTKLQTTFEQLSDEALSNWN